MGSAKLNRGAYVGDGARFTQYFSDRSTERIFLLNTPQAMVIRIRKKNLSNRHIANRLLDTQHCIGPIQLYIEYTRPYSS